MVYPMKFLASVGLAQDRPSNKILCISESHVRRNLSLSNAYTFKLEFIKNYNPQSLATYNKIHYKLWVVRHQQEKLSDFRRVLLHYN